MKIRFNRYKIYNAYEYYGMQCKDYIGLNVFRSYKISSIKIARYYCIDFRIIKYGFKFELWIGCDDNE